MKLVVVGISHKTASVRIREKFSFTKSGLLESQAQLMTLNGIKSAIILSTCNRVEIYAYSSSNGSSAQSIKGFLSQKFNFPKETIEKYFYTLIDNLAIRHLFRVACGLDSQVLGEREILGQVKSALSATSEAGLIDDFLRLIFEKAIDMGVSVRENTKLSYGNVSVGSVAMKMLKDHFTNLSEKQVLIIGAGKIASLMSKYLKEEKIKGFFVSNRTYAKARELALFCGGEVVDFRLLQEKLETADVVISSTASPHIILRKKVVEEVMKVRRNPLLLLDLAVPRDIEPEVKQIAGVSLFDLDDLKGIIEENYNKRKKEATLAEETIERELAAWSYPSNEVLRIGARKSPLALRQVEEVIGYLRKTGVNTAVTIVSMDTFGDKDKVTAISDIEGSDFFTREIEDALLKGEIDFAVHSAKDLPDEIPYGLCIAAITPSIDPFDALVSKGNLTLEQLPPGAKIAASSLRRKSQLKSYRGDLEVVDIRGNIEERLKKFDESDLDAIIIASCALKRLGLEKRIAQLIPFEILKPHPLQGSLAIETRQEDSKMIELFSKIDVREAAVR